MATQTAEFRLDPELKAEVIAMLRDPGAKQGHHALRNDDDGVCCLEMFCQVAIKHRVIPQPFYENGEWFYGASGDRNPSYLPLAVGQFFGFPAYEGNGYAFPFVMITSALGLRDRRDNRMDYGLAILNDDLLLTFLQIADLIDYFL